MPHLGSRIATNYSCNLGIRLRVSRAVNVACAPDVVVRAEQINSVMHDCSPLQSGGERKPLSVVGVLAQASADDEFNVMRHVFLCKSIKVKNRPRSGSDSTHDIPRGRRCLGNLV
jgi:hypothetical protein